MIVARETCKGPVSREWKEGLELMDGQLKGNWLDNVDWEVAADLVSSFCVVAHCFYSSLTGGIMMYASRRQAAVYPTSPTRLDTLSFVSWPGI